MASPQHLSTMEKLPCDILTNIFIRLLAKQLAQMRCVSKSLNAFLSRSSFIKSHLQRSIRSSDAILLEFHTAFSFRRPFTARPTRSPRVELSNIIKLPVSLQSISGRGNVVGSVNGLICFNYGPVYDSVYYIWNPSLSAVLKLPPSAFPSHDYDMVGIPPRFGYDPKSNDYKVIKVTVLVEPPNMMIFNGRKSINRYFDPEKDDYKVEVYSMGKGSWELITHRFPSHVSMSIHNNEVCVDGHDGHIHWLGDPECNKQQTIVAFDLGAETFCEIPLPESVQITSNIYRLNVLGVLGGKLSVISSVSDGALYGECEVWVMDEYGVVESWVKNHVFSQFSMLVPFGFTLRNEFLFQVDEMDYDDDEVDDHRFGLYDPVSAKVKIFKSPPAGTTQFVEYVDSLVWVAPDKSDTSCCSISRLQI